MSLTAKNIFSYSVGIACIYLMAFILDEYLFYEHYYMKPITLMTGFLWVIILGLWGCVITLTIGPLIGIWYKK